MSAGTAAGPPASLDLEGLRELRSSLASLSDAVPRAEGTVVEETHVASVRCLVVAPHGPAPGTILYVHGGAFCLFRADPYLPMAGHLAAATRTRVVIPDYDLPPEHPFPVPLLQVLAVYAMLRTGDGRAAAAGIDHGGPFVLAGDSAGANLALGAVRLARELALPPPDLVVLFSPWLDLALRGASVERNRATDTELEPESLAAYARAYAGAMGLDHPLVSPRSIEAPFPPLLVQAGEHEILLDDAADLVASARAAGVEATLDVAAGMQHNYQFWGPLRAEALRACARVGDRIAGLRANATRRDRGA